MAVTARNPCYAQLAGDLAGIRALTVMARFSFLQRDEPLSEQAHLLELKAYVPRLELEGLLTGVDNLRHDVVLSTAFVEAAQQQLARLIAKYGNVEDIAAPPPSSTAPSRLFRVPDSKTQAPRPGSDPGDFKRLLGDLLVSAVNRAKAEGNLSLDLLVRLAVIKLLRAELLQQFQVILDRCRIKLQAFEGPRQINADRAVELRERYAAFRLAKAAVLRKAGQEIFQTLREVEKESLLRMRRALFGDADLPAYSVLLNRLCFTETGTDDYINAEHYVLLGKYERDPDRFATVAQIVREFFSGLEISPEVLPDPSDIEPLLNVPENAQELVGGGSPDESTPKGKVQKALLNAWLELLDRYGVTDFAVAAYESASLLPEYSPAIHPQQLKMALVSRSERQRVEKLMAEHGRLSPDSLRAALRRVASCRGADRAKLAGRFLYDFLLYHRDLRSLEQLNLALDRVHLLANERLRELSAINHTLYEFLLPQEQKPEENKVVHHVILKADIRDSTTLTRTLFERGLNPASYFSLNFYEPVNKLLAKYGASKVFIEGDAIILALFGHEGEPEFAVARTCVLAREMIAIVRGYNDQSRKSGLPILELGIGISFQDSPPMYLMDGSTRIMISKALNESDRLSSCNKGARRFLAELEPVFNVFSFKTVEDADTGGNPDEFLMRYNVGGININESAFGQLRQEISLQLHEITLRTLWGKEKVRLHTGLVPLGGDMFHRVVVRESSIPRVDASDFSFLGWTDRHYYEVCTNNAVYQAVERGVGLVDPAQVPTP